MIERVIGDKVGWGVGIKLCRVLWVMLRGLDCILNILKSYRKVLGR